MVSNCSLYPLEPVDPAFDPAYHDGVPPRPRTPRRAGEIRTDWPIVRIPAGLDRMHTISL